MSTQSTYAYRARDASGEVVTGSMVASSEAEVSARLRAEGKYVLDVDDRPMRAEAQLDAEQIRRNEAAKRVRREDVIALCQQLSVMLETGVPLSEALDAFRRRRRARSSARSWTWWPTTSTAASRYRRPWRSGRGCSRA